MSNSEQALATSPAKMLGEVKEYKDRVDIGRMGENIVTNCLLENQFLVTHLDKGTRGVSANADLLVGHRSLDKPILIQVKACRAFPEPNWIFLGSPNGIALNSGRPFYNGKLGFKADVLAAVSISSPKKFRVFFVNIDDAERAVTSILTKRNKLLTRRMTAKKLPPKLYLSVAPELVTGTEILFLDETKLILKGEDNLNVLLGCAE
ncbi:hypothetical protein SAMN05444161_5628 [Rhizobiales bacterium GAS191]|nr:hypothetical protein SAMN05444161_5628 [Rhizobiales bacterium GAS191]